MGHPRLIRRTFAQAQTLLNEALRFRNRQQRALLIATQISKEAETIDAFADLYAVNTILEASPS